MFHIILFILKIFGIILLSIAGIFLFLVLILLFVPIRYHLDAEKNENVKVIAKISWLLHLLFCQITFHNSKFHIRLRILGKIFYDSDKPKEKVEKDVKRTSIRLAKKAKRRVIDEVEELGKVEEIKEHEKIEEIEKVEDIEEKRYKPPVEEIQEDNSSIQQEGLHPKDDTIVEEDQIDIKTTHGQKQKKENRLIAKIKQILNKIKGLFERIKDTLFNMKEKLVEIKAAWITIKDFFKNETNKTAVKKIFVSLKKILKHIRPSKVRINMEFGTGDPCQTGQVLGGIAILYGCYGEAIRIIPNFETEIYEGTLFLKGRIRLFTLLIISIKLLINKEFRQFVKNLRAVKEEL